MKREMEEAANATREGLKVEDTILRLQQTEVSLEDRSRSPLLSKQMPGLDVLRGVAVLSVYFFHASGTLDEGIASTQGARMLRAIASPGWAGVNLFFVLSGFLITGKLLDTKMRPNYWSSFYVRRALRILPVYLVILLLTKAYFHLHWIYVVMCVLYAANIANYFSSIGPGYGPLWSLAVEEQFYLVWPLMVRRLTLRGLAILSCAIIVVCPVLRGLSLRYPWLGDTSTTWQAADFLAWGALVAIFLRSRYTTLRRVHILCLFLWSGGFLLLGILYRFGSLSTKTVLGVALKYDAILMFFTLTLVLALLFGENRWVLRWSAPIRFFGFISYGFYLFHVLLLHAYVDVFQYFHGPVTLVTARFLLVRCAVVLLCCTALSFLSRAYFEERFLRLKERLVPYGVSAEGRRGSRGSLREDEATTLEKAS